MNINIKLIEKYIYKVAHEVEITYYKELFDLRKNSTKELWANLHKVCSLKKKSGSSNGNKNNCE